MPAKRNRGTYIKHKLLNRYRLVILNKDTFEERFSLGLNRLNVFVYSALFAILLIGLTIVLIAFTGLKEYIPGYSSTNVTRHAIELEQRVDSLQVVLAQNEQYLNSIKLVLSGNVEPLDFDREAIRREGMNKSEIIQTTPSTTDSLLRQRVSQEDKYNPLIDDIKVSLILFPPVKGVVSEEFSLENKHYAVDVIPEPYTPVKAVADGIVIFAEWSVDTGNVIIIKHSNNLISVYKHNASLTKQQGELVQAGEVIGTVGNSGDLSTGPHLHFELWYDGYPIDPTNFIEFKL